MFKDIPIDEITRVISLATAPAFLLGAVASLLSLLVSRLTRISELIRAMRAENGKLPADQVEAFRRQTVRRMRHVKWAIILCVHSGIVTGWMVVLTFVDALFGFHNGPGIAMAFIAAMVLFTTALIFFLLEIQLAIASAFAFEEPG